MPKISVVLPTYNGIQFIEQSIRSVLMQTYKDFELIVIDDCSTDGTGTWLDQFAECDSRIRVYHNETNLKLPASLNKGFSMASGEYFTWTSDDNWYEEDALEMMVNALEENPDAGLVYCNCVVINEKDRIIDFWKLSEPDWIRTSNCIGACFLYRKTIADKIGGYDTTMFLAEDYDYWLRIYENSKLIHLPQYLYRYRMHESSLTATRRMEACNQNARLWMNHMDFLVTHVADFRELCVLFDRTLSFAADDEKKSIYHSLCRYSRRYQVYHVRKRVKLFWRNIVRRLKGKEKLEG
jgi:glycosyltransferase involved in cell wall biosynthesis